MRNATFTKALLCGIMATTFFLINCQKAPSRGVKAKSADGSVTTGDGKIEAQDQDVVVACSDSFLKNYTEADKLMKELETKAKSDLANLSNTEKEQISLDEKEARAKLNDAIAEITKVDPKATACKKAGTDFTYIIKNIKYRLDRINISLKDKNVSTEGQAEAIERQEARREELKKKLAQKNLDKLSDNMELNISDELAEVLKQDNIGGVVYFKNDKIVKNSDTLDKDKADTSTTMCQLGEGTSEVQKGEKGTITNIEPNQTKDILSKRYKLLVTMSTPTGMVAFECFIKDSARLKYGEEFRAVFKSHLKTKENIEKDVTKTEERNLAVKKAKEELTTREEAVLASDKAIVEKEGELAQNAINLDEAKVKKDEALQTAITEERKQLEASIVELKAEHEKLKKLVTEAKEALKKAETEAATSL